MVYFGIVVMMDFLFRGVGFFIFFIVELSIIGEFKKIVYLRLKWKNILILGYL